MDIQAQAKRISKAIKKNEADASELKKLLEGKFNKHGAEFIINRMIVRSESIWQYIRYLGRTLNEKKGKNEEAS